VTNRCPLSANRNSSGVSAYQRAYGGDALKAMDQAKGMQDDLNKKAVDSVEKAEKTD